MRAYEFINEAKTHGRAEHMGDRKSGPLPGVYVQKDLRNTDPYMQYRYGVAVATARANRDYGVEFSQETDWAENLTQVMYAPEDEETIKLASKLMGVKPTKVADNESREPSSTTATSPVAKPKPNRYGV